MKSLRPHRQFNFVGLWKYGLILSGILIALAAIGLVVSLVTTGSALTLGTEFSGGTSIQITNTGDITQDQVKDAFSSAADSLGIESQISSIQTSTDASGNPGFIVKMTNTVSTDANQIMMNVESQLGINGTNVQIETIGASWGASVIGSSILAFLLSCVGILIVIAIRYREPRMGVVALITLFHDMFIIIGVYAWAGMFFHMEVTSDVIAALLAIIGYSLYDTIVVFHRINKNASPQMKCSMKTCANRSVNEIDRALAQHVNHVDPPRLAHAHLGHRHAARLRLRDVLRHADRRILDDRHLGSHLHAVEMPPARVRASREEVPVRGRPVDVYQRDAPAGARGRQAGAQGREVPAQGI